MRENIRSCMHACMHAPCSISHLTRMSVCSPTHTAQCANTYRYMCSVWPFCHFFLFAPLEQHTMVHVIRTYIDCICCCTVASALLSLSDDVAGTKAMRWSEPSSTMPGRASPTTATRSCATPPSTSLSSRRFSCTGATRWLKHSSSVSL